MNLKTFSILSVSLAAWQEVVEWEKAEQWDLGLDDEANFIRADPNGFFIGYDNGKPVASLSIVNFNDTYSHVGHFLVIRDKRRQGFGLKIWEQCISRANPRSSGLDSVINQREHYEKWGYVASYKIFRLSCIIKPPLYSGKFAVEEVNSSNLAEVIDFDAVCIGYRRDPMLKNWFSSEGRWGFITRANGVITGLIGTRNSTAGIRIGPLYAVNFATLERLFKKVCSLLPKNKRVTVDVPEFARDALVLFYASGMTEQFYTYRMYRGVPPDEKTSLIKGVASLDLG
ncbi:GNAT family N-acetyltransferase [Photorhabdus laumondii]|uniref:N-acetyltransferase n=1 Tax=Photorhabdus laumondii subsp. clarkei TaxID=2029685 RepID=A0A329VCG2_9GAMM|nr:GNAT family N-acetyltransferase [Photorhabdus laumondii]RAW86905.1 N-acetyltransferase [Photorhabdus laumondii subsp. clarkei]